MMDRVFATYWIETAFPLAHAAETMAGEQSTGTFVRVPGETDALREAHSARVESIEELGDAAAPSLPGAGLPKGGGDGRRRTARVVLSWPVHNFGPSLPNLLATVAGNLSELKAFSGLKLLDLKLPPVFLERYQGPQFGVAGTRTLAGVHDRPMIGTIIKPSVGLDPEATAAQVKGLLAAGIDFIKDDELQSDGPACPFEARVAAVMRVINDHADRTGKKVMFAANLTGDIDEMLSRHDYVLSQGGTCIMASMNSIGLPAMKVLRAHSQLPIHGHRNGWGMLGRSPAIGMSYLAFQKLWRLAGIDHSHVNGIDNKFCETNESVIASARECLTPMFDAPHHGCEIMPVFSSGQSVKQAHATYAALESVDLIYAAGGGILAHPGGPAAGVTALRQAWDAAVAGVPLADAAKESPELREAVAAFAG
ncbi:ribulose-bisphosphate carboxylase large subunit family protein [Hephaestia sp. GCM10023244]|uniref:ribulose-bisphosphate carboxylase large subunit family protein n=1 Tax=unclassified Hephaestia TaxID=2631281 RepID=UPI002076DB72|nr:ribulose-bisphosphate carboxylase large subunit family protein [Hephaestia sp. MAHUQ-44]MCM8730556.1 ribulose-bisphosphate carboxylase large subunit family protein [Hephaestia sp. MAHUQ-44]